jgi:hypothetical protein
VTTKIESVFGRNITLVYKSIDQNSIDIKKAKSIFEKDQPAVIQIPDSSIIFSYPDKPILIEIENRRIVVAFNFEEEEIGNYPICDYSEFFNDLVMDNGSKLTAFGINLDFGVLLGAGASKKLIEIFTDENKPFWKNSKYKLSAYYPKFTLQVDDLPFTFNFTNHDQTRIKIHSNVHYASEILFETEKLKNEYLRVFDKCKDVILGILG